MIAILGILAGVVVFAVQGLGDKGQSNACKVDTRTVKTAQEAYFSQTGGYAPSMAVLANTAATPGAPKFLDAPSTLHDLANVTATGYDVIVAAGGGGKCGAAGATVNGTSVF